MIIVTGGAGFIGSNLISALNQAGRRDVIVVDNLKKSLKFRNLLGLEICDYYDKEEFLRRVPDTGLSWPDLSAVFHLGACSDTTESDGRYMMRNNYTYSKTLLEACLNCRIPFIYASSAAVYGRGECFAESPECEMPLNIYGYSKLLFDQLVRRRMAEAESQVAGLRYFNVYGPGEGHKGAMASVAYHFRTQLRENGQIRLFKGSGGYGDGEQRRDFLHVSDAAAATLWFFEHPAVSGIFNVGTGRSRSFNAVADQVVRFYGVGEKTYVEMPAQLAGKYQSYTQADLGKLRAAGCDLTFRPLEEGMPRYLEWLERNGN
jgi:ADP-L-glycero-D-manno-heptose 6-epimerase